MGKDANLTIGVLFATSLGMGLIIVEEPTRLDQVATHLTSHQQQMVGTFVMKKIGGTDMRRNRSQTT